MVQKNKNNNKKQTNIINLFNKISSLMALAPTSLP